MNITLRAARINAKLSTWEASRKIGVSESSIRRWETNIMTITLERLVKLAQIYGVPPTDILLSVL